MSLSTVTCIEDLRQIARRREARAIFDYVDRGSYDEDTLNANRNDLEAIKLRQRVLIDVGARSTQGTILGETVTMPVSIAPTGLTGLNWGDGEILAARAAEKFGIPFTLSTMSICSIEDVAAATRKPFWFQLYVMRDRGFAASLVERAKEAGCSALNTVSAFCCSKATSEVATGSPLVSFGPNALSASHAASASNRITISQGTACTCASGFSRRGSGASVSFAVSLSFRSSAIYPPNG